VLIACSGSIAASYGTVAGPLGHEFHPSRGVMMLSMTVMAAVSGCMAPFVGSYMDGASMRKLMSLGAVLFAAAYGALSQIGSFNHALIVYGTLFAVANVLIGPVAITVLLSRWFSQKRGMAIGIAIAGIGVGTIIFPPLIQLLFNHFPWRTAVQLLGLVMLVVALPAALLVIENPAMRGLHPDGAAAAPDISLTTPAQISVWAILTDPAFWVATGIFVAVLSGMKGMATNLQPMAVDVGITPLKAASLVSLYGATAVVAKVGFALLADRLSPSKLMLMGLAGYAAGMGCLANASAGYAMIAAGVSFVGLAGGIMTPMQSYLIPRIFNVQSVGRAYGLMSTVMFVFLMATPPIFGWIKDVTGSYSVIYLVFIGLTACAMIAVPFLRLQPKAAEPI
ncbi:MAG: hypothetical protein RLY97_2120, partial [Pseudomonadota bacterium]